MEFLTNKKVILCSLFLSIVFHGVLLSLLKGHNQKSVVLIPMETSLWKKMTEAPSRASPRLVPTYEKKGSSLVDTPKEMSQVSSGEGVAQVGKGEIGEFNEAQALQSLEPLYPELSRRKGEEGLCVVALRISSVGVVEEARIEKSSGYRRLDEGALEQVRKVQFKPAMKGQKAVATEKKIVFKFELKK